MADRKVSVGLELRAAGFKAEATAAEAKVDALDRKVDALDRSITKIPPDAAKAAAAMKLLGDESGKAGLKLDDLNKRTSMDEVDRRLVKTRGEVRALAEEFNRTGDVNVLERMFGADRELKELTSLRKRLVAGLGDAGTEGGKEFGKNFGAASQGILSTPGIGPAIAVAITEAILSAAPLILATLNGVLLAAAGGGGLALGIAGQLHDPQVHKAFADVGSDLSKTLTASTTSFKQPLIGAAHIFGDALSGAIRSVDFTSLSKVIEPLARGLGGLVTSFMPGFNKALEAAGPILAGLAADLPKLGAAIGQMFEHFAQGGKGAGEALHLLVIVVGSLAEAIGLFVLVGSKMLEWFFAAGEKIGDFISHINVGLPLIQKFGEAISTLFHFFAGDDSVVTLARNLHDMGTNAALSTEQLNALSAKIGETTVTADTLAGAMSQKMFSSLMSIDQGVLSVNQSLTQLQDSFKQNGRSIDEHTAKGQANVQAIYGAVTANMQLYQAQIASGMSATDAAGQYDANTAALERQLRKAGLTQQQIDGLIGKYKAVPDAVNTDIAAHGLTDAINNLSSLLIKLNHLDGRDFGFTVTETDIRRQINEPGNFGHVQRWGGIYQHAASGLLNAKVYAPSGPARYAFAEPATGGEAFVPRFGDYNRSTGILDQAARWYGGRFVAGGMGGGGTVVHAPITINAGLGTNGTEVGRQIADQLRPFISSSGGNVQVALGRRGQ